jgi:predicted nuclease with TOPRIM domain
MREPLENRLHELKNEFETGQRMLAELDAKQSGLRTTLLKISGAIQELEVLLAEQTPLKELPEQVAAIKKR